MKRQTEAEDHPTKSVFELLMFSEIPDLNLRPRVQSWLPGDTTPTVTTVIISVLPTNILGLDLLKGKAWIDSKGREWKFGSPVVLIRLLQTVPQLPPPLKL